MTQEFPAPRPPIVGIINCPYCGARHNRRFACNELIQAALEHDIRMSDAPSEWQKEALSALRDELTRVRDTDSE